MKKQLCLLKKIIVCLFLSVFIFSCFSSVSAKASTVVSPAFPDTSGARSIYLYNYECNKIIFSKGMDNKNIAPASTVKIMSGLLAIDHLENRLDEDVTITGDMLRGVEGSTVKLKSGDVLKIKDLLYGLICGGGNDAAIVLAYICSGSVDSFVGEMNQNAVEFGMINTHYTNPTGIDDAQMKTSLSDTVIISQKAIENELFLKISSTQIYEYSYKNSNIAESKKIYNKNALISTFTASGYQNKKVKGLNAGVTDKGGYCVSTYATDGQDSYLCIVMGATEGANNKIMSYKIANDLMDYVFNNYTYAKIANKGDVVSKITVDLALPINGTDAVYVNCILENDIFAFAPKNVNYKNALTYKIFYHNNELTAPVNQGTVIGGVDIYYNDEYLATARLLTETYIAESKLLVVLDQMKNYMLSRTTFIFILTLIPCLALYFYFTFLKKHRSTKISALGRIKRKR